MILDILKFNRMADKHPETYEGKNLGEGKKSYSISFMLQDEGQTLTDKVIDATMDRLIQRFEKELGAVIRK
jgi:phenylalanyl-tRNA synthetase beta chain